MVSVSLISRCDFTTSRAFHAFFRDREQNGRDEKWIFRRLRTQLSNGHCAIFLRIDNGNFQRRMYSKGSKAPAGSNFAANVGRPEFFRAPCESLWRGSQTFHGYLFRAPFPPPLFPVPHFVTLPILLPLLNTRWPQFSRSHVANVISH